MLHIYLLFPCTLQASHPHLKQRQLDIEKCRKIGFKTAQEIIDAYLRSVSKAQAAADGDYPKQQK